MTVAITEIEIETARLAAAIELLNPTQRVALARRALAALQPEDRQLLREGLRQDTTVPRPCGPHNPLQAPTNSQKNRKRHRHA